MAEKPTSPRPIPVLMLLSAFAAVRMGLVAVEKGRAAEKPRSVFDISIE